MITKTQRHVCFDLETLGNNNQSPIIQIGAVKFDLEKGIYDTYEQNVGYGAEQSSVEVDLKTGQFKAETQIIPSMDAYKVDYSTIMWWMSQSDGARKSLITDKVSLKVALKEFLGWIGYAEDYLFWSMATFDAPIINYAIKEELGQEYQIPFRNFRDFRTIVDVANLEKDEFIGIKHNALDDATNEAKAIIKALQKLI